MRRKRKRFPFPLFGRFVLLSFHSSKSQWSEWGSNSSVKCECIHFRHMLSACLPLTRGLCVFFRISIPRNCRWIRNVFKFLTPQSLRQVERQLPRINRQFYTPTLDCAPHVIYICTALSSSTLVSNVWITLDATSFSYGKMP